MTLRTLLVIAAFFFVSAALRGKDIPQDAESFEKVLKELGRKPGPMGYFNSVYMAFTLDEAENFPNLVALHSEMRQMKTTDAHGTLSLDNTSTKRRRRRKRNIYTNVSTECEPFIGGLKRLCVVCPAVTYLGEDRVPKYINEVVCETPDGNCGEGSVLGKCKNATIQQDFLIIRASGDYEPYMQPIRVCCECGIYPS